jgi:hypothetical protein
VAATTGVLRYLVIKLCDLDCVGVSSGREVERMPESVICLYRIFPDDVVRGVAVVAGSDRVMARLQPCVVLSPHYMTIHACSGIVRQIRISLGIHKGVRPQSECQANEHSRHNQGCLALHETFRDKEAYSQSSAYRQRKVIVERRHSLTRRRRRRLSTFAVSRATFAGEKEQGSPLEWTALNFSVQIFRKYSYCCGAASGAAGA